MWLKPQTFLPRSSGGGEVQDQVAALVPGENSLPSSQPAAFWLSPYLGGGAGAREWGEDGVGAGEREPALVSFLSL